MNFWRINLKTVGQISKEFRMKAKNLKLIARTKEDLRVVSAHLQDAIVNISDIDAKTIIKKLKNNCFFLLELKTLNSSYNKKKEF